MPTAGERLVWGYGDGSTLPVFATEIGKLGAVICWENYMPLLRTAMYAKGIQLYCAPTADGRDSWLATVRHIACEGRCFVLSCNQFARRRDYPLDFVTAFGDDPEAVLSRGGSCIIGPLGSGARRSRLRGGDDPRRRPRPRRDPAGAIGLRRRRPLRAAGCLPAGGQRAADAGGGTGIAPPVPDGVQRSQRPMCETLPAFTTAS